MNDTVLISGASIAGPSLAYWLHRCGFRPTVVEKASTVRPGGYLVRPPGRGSSAGSPTRRTWRQTSIDAG